MELILVMIIFLIHEKDVVRLLASKVPQQAGYKVLQAACGKEGEQRGRIMPENQDRHRVN